VEENLSGEKGEWIMTLAQKIKDEGVQQGIQQGIQQGLIEGIAALLEIKFGDRGLNMLPEVEKIADPERLRQIKDIIRKTQGIQNLEKILYH